MNSFVCMSRPHYSRILLLLAAAAAAAVSVNYSMLICVKRF
jgi:hypothetical protein